MPFDLSSGSPVSALLKLAGRPGYSWDLGNFLLLRVSALIARYLTPRVPRIQLGRCLFIEPSTRKNLEPFRENWILLGTPSGTPELQKRNTHEVF